MKRILLIGLRILFVFFITVGAVMAEEESSEISAAAVSTPVGAYQTHWGNEWDIRQRSQTGSEQDKSNRSGRIWLQAGRN